MSYAATIMKIALRNVLRHKRRILLTALTMMTGIGLYIGMDSMLKGLDNQAVENLVNLSQSAVKIYTAEYDADREAFPLKNGIEDLEALHSVLKKDRRILQAAPRTLFIGELSNYEDSLPILGTVIDPELDSTVFSLRAYIEGSYFSDSMDSTHDLEHEIIIGKRLANELGLAVGDWITLIAQTRYQGNNADDFKVVGLLNTSEPAVNASGVFLSYAAADYFLDLDGLVTELNLKIEGIPNFGSFVRHASAVRDGLRRDLPDHAVYSFDELEAGFLDYMEQESFYTMFITMLILLIAGVGIVNTVLMSVYERVREIGILRAFGFGPKAVQGMFLIEGAIIGVLGSILGVLLGILFDLYLIIEGYDFEALIGNIDAGGFPVWGVFYGAWNVPSMIFGFFFGLAVAVVSSFIPARKAAKLEVTNALKFM